MGKSVLIKIDSARQERILAAVVQGIFEKMMGLNLSAPARGQEKSHKVE